MAGYISASGMAVAGYIGASVMADAEYYTAPSTVLAEAGSISASGDSRNRY